MEDFITVATFNFPHEIVVLKHRLDQEGLHYFFENETTLGIVPFYSNAIGGIRLKVHPNDFEIVKQILDDFRDTDLKIV